MPCSLLKHCSEQTLRDTISNANVTYLNKITCLSHSSLLEGPSFHLSLNCMKGRSAYSIVTVCVCVCVCVCFISTVSLPSNLLLCKSELFITPRKEDIIQPSIFPFQGVPIFAWHQAKEARLGGSGVNPVTNLFVRNLFSVMNIKTFMNIFIRTTYG